MKKKIIFLACCLMTMFLITACGSSKEVTYGDYTKDDLEYMSERTAASVLSLSQEEVIEYTAYYHQYAKDDEDAAMNYALLSDWAEIMNQVGEFRGYSDFTVDKSGKTITATLQLDFAKRDARLIYVFNAFDMDVTAINIEPIYSLGETMQKAALNTLMGIGTVFVILVLISLVIRAFGVIPYLEKKFKGTPERPAETMPAPTDFDEENAADDLELVAVIAAAIACETGTSTDSFVVRSIRRRF